MPFFVHLCHIVNGLHSLNISHEDIKRSNVLVDEKGYPKLVDFGFSHFKPYGGLVKSAGGTLDYSSPEKAKVSSFSCGWLTGRMSCMIRRRTMSTLSASSSSSSLTFHTLTRRITPKREATKSSVD